MFECKYCHRPFPTLFARTQHLRQQPGCYCAYQRELAALASQTRTWQVDDPDGVPSDMEGHGLEPMDEGWDDPVDMSQERGDNQRGTDEGANERGTDGFWGSTLFEQYLATVSAKARSESIAAPVEW